MTIQEAIKSGNKYLKRKSSAGGWLRIDGDGFYCGAFGITPYGMTPADILATDWEVKP